MDGRADGEWFVRSPAGKDSGLWTAAQVERAVRDGSVGPDHLLRHVDWPLFVPVRQTRFWGGTAPEAAPPARGAEPPRAAAAWTRPADPRRLAILLAAGAAAAAAIFVLLPAPPTFDAEAHIRACGPVDRPCREARESICVCGVAPERCGCPTKGECNMRTCLAVARGEVRR